MDQDGIEIKNSSEVLLRCKGPMGSPKGTNNHYIYFFLLHLFIYRDKPDGEKGT